MHLPPLIQDLAVILSVAAVVTYIFKVIKQPVVLGYIAAGLIVGPYTPPIFSVVDHESVKVWSELGIIFLMFSLGLEFSFRKLVKLGPSAGFTGIFQIFVMIFSGFYLAKGFGWSFFDAIFLGCMISISSTTIIIKSLEELNLKSRRFAEFTFGILIIEDLAAILMLVALTNFVTKSEVSASSLLLSMGKLILVVSTWMIFGLFIVPRLVRRVTSLGNDEMLTIASLALCLGLVSVAAHLEYSVALGAFIMGSILAETGAVKRIEKLTEPLRDVFGAIFFVSVGMLLNPHIIVNNFSHVLFVSLVIIVGKILSVFLGALVTGQSVRTSISTGFSMAQIGEFSFILAGLGQSLGVINDELYPVIVAASLVTTFTTPYLVKLSVPVSEKVVNGLPLQVSGAIERYQKWFRARNVTSEEKKKTKLQFVRFGIHAAVVVTLFAAAAKNLPAWLGTFIEDFDVANAVAWVVTMIVVSPFIWAMLNTFRTAEGFRFVFFRQHRLQFNLKMILSWLVTALFISFLSGEFFSGWVSLLVFFAIFFLFVVFFRVRVGEISTRIEKRFLDGFNNKEPVKNQLTISAQKLVPWDAHLSLVEIPLESSLIGKTLLELQLRERYGINVIAINRDHLQVVAPGAGERVYPHDVLLCFAGEQEIEKFRTELVVSTSEKKSAEKAGFVLRHVHVPIGSPLVKNTIRNSGIYTRHNCLVVGIERKEQRIQSPKSDEVIQELDTLWLIGNGKDLQNFIDFGILK